MVHWLEIENVTDRNCVKVKLSFRLIRVKRYFISLTSVLFEMACTRFKSRSTLFFSNFNGTFYVLWVVTIITSIILFIRGLAFNIFLLITNAIADGSEIWSHGRVKNTSLAKNTLACRTTYLKKYVSVSPSSLRNISFQYSTTCRVSPLFPENAFSARVDSCKGWQSRAARESLGGLRRRLFLWETNSRIRPTSTISGEASGGNEASKVRSDESRAQESRALWKRGIALRGLRVPRQGSKDSVLILQIKGKFEIPTTCSKRRAFHHLFSSPSLRLRP